MLKCTLKMIQRFW